MTMVARTLAVVAAGAVLVTIALAQSARDIRGASPYVAIEREPALKLIVDPPLPEGLARGVFWAQYRVENVRVVPVFGGRSRGSDRRRDSTVGGWFNGSALRTPLWQAQRLRLPTRTAPLLLASLVRFSNRRPR